MSSVTCRPVRRAPPPPTKPPPAPPVSRDKSLPTEDPNVVHTNNKMVKKETSSKEPDVKMRSKGSSHKNTEEPHKTPGKNRPPLSRDSTSFTTEDMDLFDKRKRDDSEMKKNGIKEGVRWSSKKDKRRSKSVGAPGFAGIKVRPVKPPVPVKPKFMENLITGKGLPENRKTLHAVEAKPEGIPSSGRASRPKTAMVHKKLTCSSSFESRATVTVSGSPTDKQPQTNRMSVVKDGASYVRQHSRGSKMDPNMSDFHEEKVVSGETSRSPKESVASNKENDLTNVGPVTPVRLMAKNYSSDSQVKTSGSVKKGSPRESPSQSPRSSPVPTPSTPPLKPKPMKPKVFHEQNQNSSPSVSPSGKPAECSVLSTRDDSDSSRKLVGNNVDPSGRVNLVENAPLKSPRLRKKKKVPTATLR